MNLVVRPAATRSADRVQLAALGHRQAAPAPVLQLDLLDDDEGGVERLVQHVEQELADAGNELCLLLGGDGGAARGGAFPGDLNGDDRHGKLLVNDRGWAGGWSGSMAGAPNTDRKSVV